MRVLSQRYYYGSGYYWYYGQRYYCIGKAWVSFKDNKKNHPIPSF